MRRQLTPHQRAWADWYVGQTMTDGTVVDWKQDTVGLGMFFVVRTKKDRRYHEVYRKFPPHLREDNRARL